MSETSTPDVSGSSAPAPPAPDAAPATATVSLPTDRAVTSDDIAALVPDEGDDVEAASSPAPPTPSPSVAAPTAPPKPSIPAEEPEPGPVPYSRHKAVLERARQQAADEARRELAEAAKLKEWLDTDPQGFVSYLSGRLDQARPPEDPEPDPDLQAADGTLLYSAARLKQWQAWQARQLDGEIRELRQQVSRLTQKGDLDVLTQRISGEAAMALQEARTTWPGFRDLEKTIKAKMEADKALDLSTAYIAAFREQGLSKLEAKIRADYEANLATKAQATTTRPGAPTTTPRNYADMDLREITEAVYQELAGSS